MKQKSAAFRNKIRKREIQEYCSQKRKALIQQTIQQNRIIILSNASISNQIHIEGIESMGITQTQADFCQLWRISQENIEKYLAVGSFELMANIFEDIYLSLKKILNHKKMSKQFSKNQYIESYCQECSSGSYEKTFAWVFSSLFSILQVITHTALKIFLKVLDSHPKQFTQSLFLQSDLLKFLAVCLAEPKFDKKHIQLVMNVIVHMIIVSRASTGQLFQIINSRQRSQFNISAIFYNISNINLQPKETANQNFIIMMKHYFIAIDEIQYQFKSKGIQFIPKICLNSHQIDMCFEITINSIDYYIKSPIQIQQNRQCLEEGLQVLKYLIEHTQITSKWLDRINYKRFTSLLYSANTPFDIMVNILIIIDHLIFADTTEKFPEFFIIQCDIIPTLWGLKNDYFGYVINILTNIASMPNFKPQLAPYCHQIFLNLQFCPNYFLYQFIYNWFNSQDFLIIESKDQLAIAMLRQSKERQTRITNLQSMIWLRLAENNQIAVPNRILQLDNQCSRLLNLMLENNRLQEEV